MNDCMWAAFYLGEEGENQDDWDESSSFFPKQTLIEAVRTKNNALEFCRISSRQNWDTESWTNLTLLEQLIGQLLSTDVLLKTTFSNTFEKQFGEITFEKANLEITFETQLWKSIWENTFLDPFWDTRLTNIFDILCFGVVFVVVWMWCCSGVLCCSHFCDCFVCFCSFLYFVLWPSNHILWSLTGGELTQARVDEIVLLLFILCVM